MNRTGYIFVGILLLFLITAAFRYEEYVVRKNFLLFSAVACDPYSEQCFESDCDPEVDDSCDITPYKKITIPANRAPSCILEHTCEGFICSASENCEETLCSPDTLEEGEVCSLSFINESEV